MKKLLFLLMLSVVFALTANAQIPKQFVGSYEFGEDGGKTGGGTVIYVGHDLNVKPDGIATLTANGYQTSNHVIAKAKVVGTKLQLLFEKYGEDHNGSRDLKGGELLLTIEYKKVKKKKLLWTTFSKYSPAVFEAKKGGGVYFQ